VIVNIIMLTTLAHDHGDRAGKELGTMEQLMVTPIRPPS
jgi:hypothetical protein